MLLLTSPLGRDPDINPEALEDFQNIVKYAGLNAENIFIPEQNGRKQTSMFSSPMLGSQLVSQHNRLSLIQLCPLGLGDMLADEGPWHSD